MCDAQRGVNEDEHTWEYIHNHSMCNTQRVPMRMRQRTKRMRPMSQQQRKRRQPSLGGGLPKTRLQRRRHLRKVKPELHVLLHAPSCTCTRLCHLQGAPTAARPLQHTLVHANVVVKSAAQLGVLLDCLVIHKAILNKHSPGSDLPSMTQQKCTHTL